MANRSATPKLPLGFREDAVAIVILLALWLLPWALLSVAATVAGGHPNASPYDLINPLRIRRLMATGGGHLSIEHLVGASEPMDHGLFAAVLGLALLVVVVGGAALIVARRPGSRIGQWRLFPARTLPRTSRWATRSDLRRLRRRRPAPGCFILGTRGRDLISTEKETSVLVIGPTRSGKTSGLVVPNLLAWRGPALATSTKSELLDITGGHRQSVGPVSVYDPTGELAGRYQTVTWSPIVGCEVLDHAWVMASWLCAGLQQAGAGKSDNDWSHWAESGKLLIAPLLHAAASTGGHTIIDVRNWIHAFDLTTPMTLLEGRRAVEPQAVNGDADRAIAMLVSIDQRPEKERGTVFSTVMRIFSVFNEKPVAESAISSRFDPGDLVRRRGTLYLCTPRQAPERIASLFVGILMTVVTAAYGLAQQMPRGLLEPELGLFLDELANVVPIEDLPALASQGAGRGVLLMSIVQDLSQLRSRYGADRANSILNNHPAKIVLSGISDPETTDLVARMVGTAEYTEVQVSSNNGRSTRSYSIRQQPMASPDAVRQLRSGTGIVLYRGQPPTIVRVRPWFAGRRWRALTGARFNQQPGSASPGQMESPTGAHVSAEAWSR